MLTIPGIRRTSMWHMVHAAMAIVSVSRVCLGIWAGKMVRDAGHIGETKTLEGSRCKIVLELGEGVAWSWVRVEGD